MTNPTTQHYTSPLVYTDGQLYENHYWSVTDERITNFGPLSELAAEQHKHLTTFENVLVIPGLVNTHTHSFQSLLKGFQDDQDFFTWRDKALYKFSKLLSTQDIYTGAQFAFAEMLKAGVTTVCDFFYINNQANENAQAVIQAAKDLGMRIVMARTLYDWDGAPQRFQETVKQAMDNTEALITHYKTDAMVSVIPAPHSLHGASIEMIEAGADLAKRFETVWHMHIAEGQYEREMVKKKHGLPPIKFLHKRGLLDHRTVGIHCVWLDEEEIQLMADQRAMLSYNPSSNMFLGDGITKIKEMLAAVICIGLGTDGGCSNNRSSIIEEMRMTSLLQKVKHLNSTVTQAEDMLVMGTQNGGQLLNLPIGKIAVNYFADFTVINLDDLSMQPRQNALRNLVYSSQPSAIQAVYVAGKRIAKNGQLLNKPEAEIIRAIQQTVSAFQ